MFFRRAALWLTVCAAAALSACSSLPRGSAHSAAPSPAAPSPAASATVSSAPGSRAPSGGQKASSFPAPESDPRYVSAYKAYSRRAYSEAERLCDEALRQDPGCFWAYNVKGIARYFANGNGVADECLKLIDRSTDLNPGYSYGYFNKALIQKGLRRWDDALANFNRVLKLKPGDTWSYYGIATVYADSDRNDQALDYLKKAIGTDPDGVKAQVRDDLTRHFSKLRRDPRFTELTGVS